MPGPADTVVYGSSAFRVVIAWGRTKAEVGLCWVGPVSLEPGATVTLRRAVSGATDLFEWRRDAIATGAKAKRTVGIELFDIPGGKLVATWRLDGALPVRWTGPTLDALGTAVALEELELAYDGISWFVPGVKEPVVAGGLGTAPAPGAAAGTATLPGSVLGAAVPAGLPGATVPPKPLPTRPTG